MGGSGIIDGNEFTLRRRGYARALRDPRVLNATCDRFWKFGEVAITAAWTAAGVEVAGIAPCYDVSNLIRFTIADLDKRLSVAFFRTETGTEPVRDWLKALGKDDRFRIGTDIKTVEFGWPIGMPTCRPMKRGLYEVRTNLGGRIARVLFCIADGRMVLLHGFIKKSRKTPQSDLDLALERKRKLER